MRGSIQRRGRASWRIKYDLPGTTQRQTRYQTVRGRRQDAERELAKILSAAHDGTLVEPSRTTVADYLRSWLDGAHGLADKALSVGARRGEILGVTWGNVDLTAATVRIERSLEQTRARGLKFKPPKTKHGRRTIALPPIALEALQAHRRRQLERRLSFGLGRPEEGTLVFSTIAGDPIRPNNLSRDWRRFVRARKLPDVSFHGLRHSHASALIASGVDPLTVSRRIGHANVST